mgnify:CR=1 FL=1
MAFPPFQGPTFPFSISLLRIYISIMFVVSYNTVFPVKSLVLSLNKGIFTNEICTVLHGAVPSTQLLITPVPPFAAGFRS